MTTDLRVALARQSETQAQTERDFFLVLLGSISLCLANLGLVFVSPAFASAVALVGQY